MTAEYEPTDHFHKPTKQLGALTWDQELIPTMARTLACEPLRLHPITSAPFRRWPLTHHLPHRCQDQLRPASMRRPCLGQAPQLLRAEAVQRAGAHMAAGRAAVSLSAGRASPRAVAPVASLGVEVATDVEREAAT